MAKATMVVFTNPVSADAEDEYNEWYDNIHLADVVAIDGFVSAQRFRVVDVEAVAAGSDSAHRYLALYEVESDDLNAVAQALLSRAGTADMEISPTLDRGSKVFFVEPIGAPVLSP